MKAQISRDSYQEAKQYSGVYQQQGRMLTDADWNEMVRILKNRMDRTVGASIGSGSPRDGGILSMDRRILIPSHPLGSGGSRTIELSFEAFLRTPMFRWGRVYVDGAYGEVRTENSEFSGKDVSLRDFIENQRDFPENPLCTINETTPPSRPSPITPVDPFPGFPIEPSPVIPSHWELTTDCVVYLDLWERLVVSVEDDNLRDSALHGADTCVRTQTMAQLKLAQKDSFNFEELASSGNATISVNDSPGTDSVPHDCNSESQESAFRARNRLFRLEVHDVKMNGDVMESVEVKWSCENAAEHRAIADDDNQYIKAEELGSFLKPTHIYECFSSTTEKHLGEHKPQGVRWSPKRSELFAFEEIRSKLNDGTIQSKKFTHIRRWDGCVTLKHDGTTRAWEIDPSTHPVASLVKRRPWGAWLRLSLLDLKVEVKLDLTNKRFLVGDYWWILLRDTGTGVKATPLSERPVGIHHHYLKLGELTKEGDFTFTRAEWRQLSFPSLTKLTVDRVLIPDDNEPGGELLDLEDKFVNRAGDEMTGALGVPVIHDCAQISSSSDSITSGSNSLLISCESGCSASGDNSLIINSTHSQALGNHSQIVGSFGTTTDPSIASGNSSQINGSGFSKAQGGRSQVNGSHASTASGHFSQVNGSNNSTSGGIYSQVNGSDNATASGLHSQVNGSTYSAASGAHSQVHSSSGVPGSGEEPEKLTVASGPYSIVSGSGISRAEGGRAQVNGSYDSMAIGGLSQINGSDGSTATGFCSQVNGSDDSKATSTYSQVESSRSSEANGIFSQVNGSSDSEASGDCSQVNGSIYCQAKGDHSQVNGSSGKFPSGENPAVYSVANGRHSSVNGSYQSTSEGEYSQVNSSTSSTAIGRYSQVNGSHASTSGGDCSQVNGSMGSHTSLVDQSGEIKFGKCAQVNGSFNSTASGEYSQVNGSKDSTSSGNYSQVNGSTNSTASGEHSCVNNSNELPEDPTNHRVLLNPLAISSFPRPLTSHASGRYSQVSASSCGKAKGVHSRVDGSVNCTAHHPHSQILASLNVASGRTFSVCGGSPEPIRTFDVGFVKTAYFDISVAPHRDNRKWELDSLKGELRLKGSASHDWSDYGEYFENLIKEEMDMGRLVALDDRDCAKVRAAKKGEHFIGVVSGTAAIRLGDSPFCWHGRYKTDEWGRPEYETIKDPSWEPKQGPDPDWKPGEGETEADRPMIALETEDDRPEIRVRKTNPQYDPKKTQIPRSERPDEWTLVGLLGQVYVRCDETVEVGKFIESGDYGVGTKSASPTKLRAMKKTQDFNGEFAIFYCLLC